MVIGNTRCGKSTVLNLIMGNQLDAKEIGTRKKVSLVLQDTSTADGESPHIPAIGTGQVSQTTVPSGYVASPFFGSFKLWDNPGFGDTRGPQQEILNAYLVNRLFTTATGFKLLNLIDYESIYSDNPAMFMSYIKQMKDLFGDAMQSMPQCLAITKVVDEGILRGTIQGLITDHYSRDTVVRKFFHSDDIVINPIPRARAGEIWGQKNVAELVKSLELIEYVKIPVEIGINTEAKYFLLSNAGQITEALISEYIKCFKGTALLKTFYENLDKSISNVEVLNRCFEEQNPKAITEYINSNKDITDHYRGFERETSSFVQKVNKDIDLSTVQTMQNFVKTYCSYELKYCSNIHMLKYLQENTRFIEVREECARNIDKILESHKSFADIRGDIANLIAIQDKCDKAKLEAIKSQNDEDFKKAQKEFETDCEEVSKRNHDKMEEHCKTIREYAVSRATKTFIGTTGQKLKEAFKSDTTDTDDGDTTTASAAGSTTKVIAEGVTTKNVAKGIAKAFTVAATALGEAPSEAAADSSDEMDTKDSFVEACLSATVRVAGALGHGGVAAHKEFWKSCDKPEDEKTKPLSDFLHTSQPHYDLTFYEYYQTHTDELLGDIFTSLAI